jgi:cobalt-zinc-cadmium efflux system membrane fusion protein
MSFQFHRLLLPLVFAPLAWGNEILHLQGGQARALGIETALVGSTAEGREGTLPARVQVPSGQMRLVAAPVAGMIEMLAVAPGMAVRRGQAVAHLTSPEALELQREALQAASQSSLAEQNSKRDEALFAEGLIAESRLQASRAAAAQAAAGAAERRQRLALAGVAPGRLGGPLVLTSPIDGVVLEQGVQLGQRVETAALVFRIAKLSPLWLEIQVPLETAAGLRAGLAVRVAGSDISGKVIGVGRAVDPASQSVLVRAAVDKGAERLTPGQVVEVEMPGAAGGGQGRPIPASALVRHDGRTFAFVQAGGDAQAASFEVRPVRILGQGGSSALVEGLRPGERIVVKGGSGLKAMLAGVGKE